MLEEAADTFASKLAVLSAEDNGTDVANDVFDGSNAADSPKEEGIDEFIWNQTEEEDNSFYTTLLDGFRSLRENRENKKKPLFALGDPAAERKLKTDGVIKHLQSYATVNFIDPTTMASSNAAADATTAGSKLGNMMFMQQQSQSKLHSQNSTSSSGIENVFDKLTYLFERDYGSTLRSVQYKSMRSGETDVISFLPVNPVLTRTGGGSANGDANAPWAGTAGTAAAPVSDPSEWHNSPFCHVYIAAIESQEHYRSKVKPSLTAFVSQIEAAATGSQGSQSAHYLIVYIPSGPKDVELEESTEQTGRVGKYFGHRIQKARQKLASYNADTGELDKSVHSRDGSVLSEDGLSDNEDPESGTSVYLHLLTKNERSIYKRICSDFSNGKVSVLSMTSLENTDEESVTSGDVAIRSQEWSSFNRMLGAVIVNGFKDRCRRYTDELKRLDAQRASAATAAKSEKALGKTSGSSFNLSYFFLVKESLAFTYEQMHLPGDALLQYDEFRAFLPDLSIEADQKAKKARRKSNANAFTTDESSPALLELADAGDFVNFRRKIRSEFDLIPIVDTMRRYIFARELCLLFKMEQPIELISRCQAFSKLMYSVMMRGSSGLSPEDQLKRKVEAAKWVVQFSWDVKCASESYMISLCEVAQNMDTVSVDTPSSDLLSNASENTQSEQNVASALSQFLEVSRLLMKELGDTELGCPNPLRSYENSLPDDVLRPWSAWKPMDESKRNGLKREAGSVYMSQEIRSGREFLLKGAFSSVDLYEKTYLELTAAIVTLRRYSGHRRIAGRLQNEIAEHYVRKGDLTSAAAIFKAIVKICRWDQWDRCHFWRLFRLAYCQRSTAQPTDYLKTLVTCFSPRIAAVAPTKALNALQNDLEVIIGHPLVGEARYGKLAFIETEMEILETSSDESTLGSGVDSKQLLKKYCSVGENVQIQLSVSSHLPRAIELASLKLFIVSFATFSRIIEDRESVEEEDAFRILSMDIPIALKPGKNTYMLDWKPSSAGQYILSTIEIVWREGYFYYDSMELPAPLLGIDVLPSEPTHALTLDPGYLVPGHDQQVRITFVAGSDIVTSGKMQLSCSEGLTLIPPGEDPGEGNWQDGCEIEISACKPGEKTVLTTHVRCGLIENFSRESISRVDSLDAAHGLSVKAFTRYLHAETDDSSDSNIPNMKNVLEAFAPILEKTALSLEAVDAVWTIPGVRAMLNISLVSNTPHHFSVKEWNLTLPAPLQVAEGGDLNEDLLKCTVSDGDQLAMSFDCIVGKEETKSSDEPKLRVILYDDAGKTFSLDLSLDLNSFYLMLRNSDDPTASNIATAVLGIDVDEGNVGEAVMLTYTVDQRLFSALKSDDGTESNYVYSIAWEESDWLIGGKSNGILKRSDDSSLSFKVVGIPAISGLLDRFPKLKLEYESKVGEYKPLHVKLQYPQAFRSLCKTSENGVAFRTSK